LAESRLADAEIALRKATLAAANDVVANRSLVATVKDPTVRIERATNRAAVSRWEVDRLNSEINSIRNTPRTKAQALNDQTAVAKAIEGHEFHFEVRGDRVSFIDVDKLTDLVKADVRLRLKFSLPGQSMAGTVGPVGEFSMAYEMGRALPDGVAELLDRRDASYILRGWEIVPEREGRGEAYENVWQPTAVFARAIRRLDASSATITFWVYPDGFALYNRLRDDLHSRGFLVAARPLPRGTAIRGSPSGSLSAGQ
jgi:hypothetical protein